MRCHYCQHNETKVIDSRTTEDRLSVRRRRECLKCGKRFTTYERIEEIPVMVCKSDGRREAFDSKKIIRGLVKACEKRALSMHEIEAIAGRVENRINSLMLEEISSGEIGEIVMNELYQVDEVAYVRFASVYRKFADLERFRDELDTILSTKETAPKSK